MRSIALATAALLVAGAANAANITYFFDYTIHPSSSKGFQDAYAGTQSGDGWISVTGFVETDGSLGMIYDTSVQSWSFTLNSSNGGTVSYGSDLSGTDFVYSDYWAAFDATETMLTGLEYGFYAVRENRATDPVTGKRTEDNGAFAAIYGYTSGAYIYEEAFHFSYAYDCNAVDGCNYTAPNSDVFQPGDASVFYETEDSSGVLFVGTAGKVDLTPVPLPAGLPLLLVGLGSLAYLRRRA